MTDQRPNDQEHTFGVDELFFSTTDRKGVIEQANSIFVRLSHYSHDELVGSPHNIIRHPEMPAGAFRLVWQELEAGRPTCAYVLNLAKDGGRYWVFATLLPVGDGYLSVRMRPMADDLWQAAQNLYVFARSAERTARERGEGARDAATAGAETIVHGLGALGLGSFEDFARVSLPTEMAAHTRASAGLPVRSGATGPLADILDTVHELDELSLPLVAQLEEYAEVASQLRATAAEAGPTVERLRGLLATAQEGASAVRDEAPDLVSLAEDLRERAASAGEHLAGLSPRLSEVEDIVTRMRLRIALLRLHDEMVGRFAAESLDGAATGDASASMRLLCRALTEGAHDVAADVARVREQMEVVPDEIRATVREVDRFRRPVYRWQSTVAEAGLSDRLGESTAAIEAQTEEGFAEVERLSALAARLRLLDVPFDEDEMQERIHRLDAAAAQV